MYTYVYISKVRSLHPLPDDRPISYTLTDQYFFFCLRGIVVVVVIQNDVCLRESRKQPVRGVQKKWREGFWAKFYGAYIDICIRRLYVTYYIRYDFINVG